MYRSKVCIQEFWYCVPDLDIQSELSEIDNSARKKAVAICETLQIQSHGFHQKAVKLGAVQSAFWTHDADTAGFRLQSHGSAHSVQDSKVDQRLGTQFQSFPCHRPALVLVHGNADH